MHCLSRASLLYLVCIVVPVIGGVGGEEEKEVIPTSNESTVTILEVDTDDWLKECFFTFVDNCCVDLGGGDTHIFYSNFDLIDQPSGLCQDHLSCAFKRCDPTGIEQVSLLGSSLLNTSYSVVNDTLGVLNLPDSIAHVETAADVVYAVQYAKTVGKTISIKSTGHSYAGSNTMANSLQLNLRNLRKFSKDSIVECANVTDPTDENYTPCLLAQDRNKKALIKVGGGEVWSDVYVAVLEAGKQHPTGTQYDVVGGGAGSVGAAGGWLQGGGWSHGVERLYGLGIDQVLEFEMVLADGRHVRFGPSEWEPTEGYLYPKTTAVSGKCNTNVEEGEDRWIWEDCEAPVPPFADLWYAVRGGGGGTFGVVTALKYQLHEKRPMTFVLTNSDSLNAIYWLALGSQSTIDEAARFFADFLLDFLYNPSSLGISQETSNLCGSPALFFNVFWYSTFIYCYDDGFEQMDAAWRQKVDDSDYFLLASNLRNLLFGIPDAGSYAEISLEFAEGDFRPEGRVPDNPLPNFLPDKGYASWCSAQLPERWLGDPDVRGLVLDVLLNVGGEHVTGGLVSVAHDQMNALSPAARTTGLSSTALGGLPAETQNLLLSQFINYTAETTGETGFPGMTEINHLCPDSFGPLKSNTTKICPPQYTIDEKEAECISIQESIWGTETLAKLERIKYAVDPDNLFDCYACVKPRASGAAPIIPDSVAPTAAPPVAPVMIPTTLFPFSPSPIAGPTTGTVIPTSVFPETVTTEPPSSPPINAMPTVSPSGGRAHSFVIPVFNLIIVLFLSLHVLV